LEIQNNSYDIVGISAIMTNIVKVREMCVLVRKHLPKATIVIGGHIANNADLPRIINADHIVRGDGVRWFRKYLASFFNVFMKNLVGQRSCLPRSLAATSTPCCKEKIKE
jgi:hypothetical protein